MHPIPLKNREQLAKDPFMKRCVQAFTGSCEGRVEWHHVFRYANKQIQDPWAILPDCEYHHRGEGFDKEYNEYIALKRAQEKGLIPYIVLKYPKVLWELKLKYLKKKYANSED